MTNQGGLSIRGGLSFRDTGDDGVDQVTQCKADTA